MAGLINYTDSGHMPNLHMQLHKSMPLDRGSFPHSEPLVKKGDEVKKGQLLADANRTQGGGVALGRNLITAIMPNM